MFINVQLLWVPDDEPAAGFSSARSHTDDQVLDGGETGKTSSLWSWEAVLQQVPGPTSCQCFFFFYHDISNQVVSVPPN